MNIDAAIESFFASIATSRHAHIEDTVAWAIASDPQRVPIFYLGEEEDINAAIKGLQEDLYEDISRAIPFPFDRQLLFLKVLEPSVDDVEERFGVPPSLLEKAKREGLLPSWYATLAAKDPAESRSIAMTDFLFQPGAGWVPVYYGGGRLLPVGDFKFAFQQYTSAKCLGETRRENLGMSVKETAYHLALISHPANYIVRESPLLTPKEQRRIAKGKRFPGAKRPRYIIVDHDVLVNRMDPQGTHVSPAPHQRRGHWRRLAERCKLARARGEDRVWVRDCKVGETDFVANNRRYQVLMDFHSRYGAATV